ncbi:YadA-like family protein [Salmonella enterica]
MGEALKEAATKNKTTAEKGLAYVTTILDSDANEYTKTAAEAARDRLNIDLGNTEALLRTADEMINNAAWKSGRGYDYVTYGGTDWNLSDKFMSGWGEPIANGATEKINGFAEGTMERLSKDIAADESINKDGGNNGIVMISHDTPGATVYSYTGNIHGAVTDGVGEPVTIAGTGDGRLTLTQDTGHTGEKTTAVMMGEHTITNLSTGDSSVTIGEGATTNGTSVAIGKNAVSSRDSIALGNGSTAEGRYELSLGDSATGVTRKITNMADGTSDTDGATIHNVKSEISSLDSKAQEYAKNAKDTAITIAKEYTDGAVLQANETVLTSANDYTDKAKDDAIKTAKKYTDEATLKANDKVLDEAKGYTDTAKKEAVSDAKTYTDDTAQKTLKSANDYTERRAVVAENNAVTRSNAYTDESSSRTLESANTYTNHRSVQAENNAVARSNAYTDNRFGELRKSLQHTEKRLNAGIAGVTAISSIPYAAGNKFSYGLGAGNYQNGNAIAAGVQFRVSQSANVRFNVSWDSAGNNAIGAGFSGGW